MNDKHIRNNGHPRISITNAYGGSPSAYVSHEAQPVQIPTAVQVPTEMGHSRISIEAVLAKYTGREGAPRG